MSISGSARRRRRRARLDKHHLLRHVGTALCCYELDRQVAIATLPEKFHREHGQLAERRHRLGAMRSSHSSQLCFDTLPAVLAQMAKQLEGKSLVAVAYTGNLN
jgi:hypothetical protein